MASGEAVTVEGLDALTRAANRIDRGLRLQMQKRLRVVGMIVSTEARSVAGEQGLNQSGKLISSIRPSVRGGRVFIRDPAKKVSPKYPGGYNYPARYEYEAGGARAFMRPGLQRKRQTVVAELERIVDWVATEWGA